MRDMKNNMDVVPSIPPAVYSADADGTGVDLQGFDGAMVVISTGADVGSTHAPKVQESDVLGSGYTDVAAEDLEGAFSADIGANTVERVGYKGSKRFIKAFVATSGASLAYGVNIIRGYPAQAPVA